MNEDHLRKELREAPVPEGEAAERRGWRVVHAALEAEHREGTGPRRRWARPALALAALSATLALVLTPPGEAVGDWISDTLEPPPRAPAQPALTSLPATGNLLVTSKQGPWIVQPDGSKRRLGRYREASWSPGGLFVVATRGRQLVALEPDGDVRWSLARSEPAREPAWSPDGFRIAYFSGTSLRVVGGDGTADGPVADGAASVTPAWRPGEEHVLAWASASGSVTVVQTDTGRRLWKKTGRGAPPRSLVWTADGKHLVAVFDRRLEVFDSGGRRERGFILPAGTRAGSVAMHPTTDTLALVRYKPAGNRSEAVEVQLGSGRVRKFFAGDGRFGDLAFSPDGRWLLLAWRDADQWLFIRSAEVSRIQAVSNVSRQFDPGGEGRSAFPRLSGWCCGSPRSP